LSGRKLQEIAKDEGEKKSRVQREGPRPLTKRDMGSFKGKLSVRISNTKKKISGLKTKRGLDRGGAERPRRL